MAYRVHVVADSISPAGFRLLTMEVTYPRIIHAEMLTHREFSRGSSSSRAIPVEKMIAAVESDPFYPRPFTAKSRGMQGTEINDPVKEIQANIVWQIALGDALTRARELVELGIAKQHANRLLEPFSWITVIMSATVPPSGVSAWSNFFAQRCHPSAQPEMQEIAYKMRSSFKESRPLLNDAWHLPYVREEDKGFSPEEQRKLSVARCARVSYLNHDGVRDPAKDFDLFDFLLEQGHFSPFEHVAYAMPAMFSENQERSGNFRGWTQLRKVLPGEYR